MRVGAAITDLNKASVAALLDRCSVDLSKAELASDDQRDVDAHRRQLSGG
jgi:hypothetical protein